MPATRPTSARSGAAAPADRAGGILEIDLRAVARNWRMLRARLAKGVECAAVVKADGYGLGAGPVARALEAAGCRTFFVATLNEGLALRRVLERSEIAVLNGLLPRTAAEFLRARLVPVLNDPGQVDVWRKLAATRAHYPAILHLDTGMSRLGLSKDQLVTLAGEPARLAGLTIRAVMSHLACADEPTHPKNADQCRAFRAACRMLPAAPASLASSSGIFLGSQYHFDMVRPGAALYGVNPLSGGPNPMAQVVRLKGRIIQVRDVDRGETVGYGAGHRVDRPARLATVAVGYADGWFRSSSQRGTAIIGGQHVPVVGRISMDLMTLDVTGVSPALLKPGALVDLIDHTNTVDVVAERAGTIGYEVLTALGRRYHRIYRGAPA